VAGQVIWATNIEEVAKTDKSKASGKGGPKTKTTTYSYFGNFAVGLCEGEIDGIGRVWADGKLFDITAHTTRLYTGNETQAPDSLIETIEGQGAAPAYRGLAYLVFERLPLEAFGNRLPQLSFEIFRAANPAADGVKAITIIPGATEFGYDTQVVTRVVGVGKTESENAHLSNESSDFSLSIDQLQGACRNVQAASLVVSWFGDDLRCNACTVSPRVENTVKVTSGATWSVSGQLRGTASTVSEVDGRPAYGGTPSDESVLRAITELKSRGLAVMFYPFILMDVPPGNTLANPYGGTGQPAFPWRGRITASIAPGLAGTPDKTAGMNAEINAFLGPAQPSHFTVSGSTVSYSGPAVWGYRRMILHYAHLCAAAGGVDAFLIGSELRGLTTLRCSANSYPFVAALAQLASEVKAILPGAQVSYAADWSEYFGHHPQDGTGDVFFHLDTLWASSDVGFVGIDNYLPLSDWRDGESHLDAQAGAPSIYDLGYLKSNIAGGEGFDWYYASDADRSSQLRTPITDGGYGKPWVFRNKDIRNWWLNPHYNRPAGVESSTPTGWVPQSKPIWFTEAGCAAVDKGTNQPNVFVDVKSVESALPYFSGGQRDDLIQNRYLAALQQHWGEAGAHNPVSSVYGQKMVDPTRIFVWCWDARPYPVFPARTDVWADGENVPRGHWLNGRLGSADLARVISDVAGRHGLSQTDTGAVAALADGFVIDRPMSGRDALEALLKAFAIDAVESGGSLKFFPRKSPPRASLLQEELVETRANEPVISRTRLQETDLPRAVRLAYVEPQADYRSAAVSRLRQETLSEREIIISLPAAVPQAVAQTRADVLLEESWAQRSRARLSLLPSQLRFEPGDVLELEGDLIRLTAVEDGEARNCEALLHQPSVYEPPPAPERGALVATTQIAGPPEARILDLALVADTGDPVRWVAAHAKPWPGRLSLFRLSGAANFDLNRTVFSQATMGETLNALPAGLTFRQDHAHALEVRIDHGALSSVTHAQLLDGENIAAVGTAATGYEILQFETAELIAPGTYRLRGLLRAQAGSAAEMLASRPAGQDFILLNEAVVPVEETLAEAMVPASWRIGPPLFDHGHSSYVAIDSAAATRALRPLPPAQLRVRRAVDGLDVSWIRQTRVSGDSWEIAETPLAEDREEYRLEILNGTTAVRSEILPTPFFNYSNAAMTADFGAPQTTLHLRVAQVSAIIGVGTALERTLHV
jgi:hypothetical protein